MSKNARYFDLHGIVPLRDESLLRASHAMEAEDVDLHRGDLIPWKFGDALFSSSSLISTVFDSERCGFITWDKHVPYDIGYPVCNDIGMLFWIEDGVVYQGTRSDVCSGRHIPLGVPCPEGTPSGAPGGGGEGCTSFASFRFTYVNKYGQEGPPSAASSIAVGGPNGTTVNVTAPPAGYGITKIRVYRATADGASGLETNIESTGEMVLVGEAPATTTTIPTNGVDTTAEILPSTRWSPPPTGVTSLAVCPVTNSLMLGRNNTIFVSHPGQYHAFPRDRDMVLTDNVVSLKFYSSVMVALTDGHPYVINPRVTTEFAATYKADRFDDSVPCYNPKSVAVGAAGVVWASQDGLFIIGNSRYGITMSCLTDKLFHLDDWRDADYTSIRGDIHDGKYYFTCDGEITCSITKRTSHSWILSYDDSTYEHPTNVELTSLSIRPDEWYESRRDVLYYSIGNELFEWNPHDGEIAPFKYSTRDTVETGYVNYAAAKVIHDRDGYLFFELWKEECAEQRLIFRRRIDHCKPFRLPRCLMGIDHYVRLVGTSRVRRFHLATSIYDLTDHDDTTYTHGNKRLTSK